MAVQKPSSLKTISTIIGSKISGFRISATIFFSLCFKFFLFIFAPCMSLADTSRLKRIETSGCSFF